MSEKCASIKNVNYSTMAETSEYSLEEQRACCDKCAFVQSWVEEVTWLHQIEISSQFAPAAGLGDDYSVPPGNPISDVPSENDEKKPISDSGSDNVCDAEHLNRVSTTFSSDVNAAGVNKFPVDPPAQAIPEDFKFIPYLSLPRFYEHPNPEKVPLYSMDFSARFNKAEEFLTHVESYRNYIVEEHERNLLNIGNPSNKSLEQGGYTVAYNLWRDSPYNSPLLPPEVEDTPVLSELPEVYRFKYRSKPTYFERGLTAEQNVGHFVIPTANIAHHDAMEFTEFMNRPRCLHAKTPSYCLWGNVWAPTCSEWHALTLSAKDPRRETSLTMDWLFREMPHLFLPAYTSNSATVAPSCDASMGDQMAAGDTSQMEGLPSSEPPAPDNSTNLLPDQKSLNSLQESSIDDSGSESYSSAEESDSGTSTAESKDEASFDEEELSRMFQLVKDVCSGRVVIPLREALEDFAAGLEASYGKDLSKSMVGRNLLKHCRIRAFS